MEHFKLNQTHFVCPSCHKRYTVEALGVVVSPPHCPKCKGPMKLLRESQQLRLKL